MTSNSKRKIAIIGRGNAGCLSALHFSHYNNLFSVDYETELIYDPDIKPVPTGQGSTLEYPDLLHKCLGSNWHKKFPITLKTGIMYENWGTAQDEFFHEFPLGRYSVHCSPDQFQDYVCQNLNIKLKQTKEHVLEYNQIDADYIIDCRGTPKDLSNYDKLINPLNAALLSNLPKKENDVAWTRCIATPHGWTFYIPLPNTTSVGYLYNSNITTKEEAEKDFKERFGIEKINHSLNFNQYIAKNPIIDKRIFLNGNKLFFLEPLEATAMGSYIRANGWYFRAITGVSTPEDSVKRLKEYITKVQDFILLHYEKGSKFNTPFWDYAKKLALANKSKDVQDVLNNILNMSENKKFIRDSDFEFAQWGLFSFENWINGVNIKNG